MTKPRRGAETPEGSLVGRALELAQVRACVEAGRNVLLEGPVGAGKTQLAISVSRGLDRPVYRVDGDARYTEQKLSGWFDPPTVIKKGFTADAFVAGPLIEAMRVGGILFINELNRLPEGVQNVLLPAIDERMLAVPRLGEIRAKAGFLVIATQNPKEFVATSHLSEAILDRFELVRVNYQSEDEEIQIVSRRVDSSALSVAAVRLARITRDHPRVRRGASVRAAQSIGELAQAILGAQGAPQKQGELRSALLEAAKMALPTRIEIEREGEGTGLDSQRELEELLAEWVDQALEPGTDGKKKP